MKKLIFFLMTFFCIVSCTKNSNESVLCMNEPPQLGIVIVKNKVPFDKYLNDYKFFKKEAILYKSSGSKKVKVENLDVYNENIFIFSARKNLKTFYTENLETFYVEYNNHIDTLQIKGIYYDSTGCGDIAYLHEIHFNGKKVEFNMIDHHIYKIDNTDSNSDVK